MIAALVLSLGIAGAVAYTSAMQNQKTTDIEQIALDFLRNGATFGFDGVEDSIEIQDYYILESYPEKHVVVIAFDCTHAGYGDREGTFIAQVVTSHVIRITIVEGEVISATIDEAWDELNQEQIIPQEYMEIEEVRDTALEYLISKDQLSFPEEWLSSVNTSSDIVGSSSVRYIGGEWEIDISYPVVWHPDYTVTVTNSQTGYTWSGTITSSGQVTE